MVEVEELHLDPGLVQVRLLLKDLECLLCRDSLLTVIDGGSSDQQSSQEHHLRDVVDISDLLLVNLRDDFAQH